MHFRFRALAGVTAIVVFYGTGAAELPPLDTDKLKAEADVIVLGKVAKVEAVEKKPTSTAVEKEVEYRLTVEVEKVEKGKLTEDAKTVLARGTSFTLKKGAVGTGGHRSANTSDRIEAVEKDWELRLYLKTSKDDGFDIVSPNGFEVQRKPKDK